MMIEASEVDGRTVLYLQGDLDAGSSPYVRDLIAGMITDGRPTLVLELSGVEHMYTAGMSLLLELQRLAVQSGGKLICCGARPFIREILRLTMLDRALALQIDLESALELLSQAS